MGRTHERSEPDRIRDPAAVEAAGIGRLGLAPPGLEPRLCGLGAPAQALGHVELEDQIALDQRLPHDPDDVDRRRCSGRRRR
jgi:hypothetical protein